MWATFENCEFEMTRAQAESGSHQGQCDEDVAGLVKVLKIRRQLDKLGPETIRAALVPYGAWDDEELADDAENRLRFVWIAAGNITEGN